MINSEKFVKIIKSKNKKKLSEFILKYNPDPDYQTLMIVYYILTNNIYILYYILNTNLNLNNNINWNLFEILFPKIYIKKYYTSLLKLFRKINSYLYRKKVIKCLNLDFYFTYDDIYLIDNYELWEEISDRYHRLRTQLINFIIINNLINRISQNIINFLNIFPELNKVQYLKQTLKYLFNNSKLYALTSLLIYNENLNEINFINLEKKDYGYNINLYISLFKISSDYFKQKEKTDRNKFLFNKIFTFVLRGFDIHNYNIKNFIKTNIFNGNKLLLLDGDNYNKKKKNFYPLDNYTYKTINFYTDIYNLYLIFPILNKKLNFDIRKLLFNFF